MPLPEANLFGIVIAIQQKAGGNLSEALGNLSKVLRDRKKMKAKIQAMSMEAKASAMIIGALPVAVMILVYITSPQYISLLWTEPMGQMMMLGSATATELAQASGHGGIGSGGGTTGGPSVGGFSGSASSKAKVKMNRLVGGCTPSQKPTSRPRLSLPAKVVLS